LYRKRNAQALNSQVDAEIVKYDVLGFGIVTVDDFLVVDRYPPPGAKMPVRDRYRQGGGLTGTALVAAARLGARAAFAGVLGTDELSTWTRAELEREGVDCSAVITQPDARVNASPRPPVTRREWRTTWACRWWRISSTARARRRIAC